jgi:hypothetical protein
LHLTDLLSASTMTLATSGTDGAPHATPVYFAADENLHLYFFSDPQSLHGQHVAHHPRAAASLYPLCSGWEDIRGLQMQGEIHPVEQGAAWDAGWEIYAAKFPFVKGLKDIVASNTLYVFIPHWVRLVDNRRGFGFKQEWTIP